MKNAIFYLGITNKLLWFDFGKWFSIDIGKFFMRLYVHITDCWYCKYWGQIK